jgi:hypothetical protein
MKNTTTIISAAFCLLMGACSNNINLSDNINTNASIPDSFKFSPAGLKVITSSINKKQGTMSTLYGNPLALKKSIGLNKEVVAGEEFTLVTWQQQPDAHWFGANIPGDLQSIEVLRTTANGETVAMNYHQYQGKNLVLNTDTVNQRERIKYIFDQRPSVMP